MSHVVGQPETLLTGPSNSVEDDTIPMDKSGGTFLRPLSRREPASVEVVHLRGPQRARSVYRGRGSICSCRTAIVTTSLAVAAIGLGALAYTARSQLQFPYMY